MLYWSSLLAAAVCLCTIMFLCLSPGWQNPDEPSAVPQIPRLGFLWPWVSALGFFVSPFLTWKYQLRMKAEIVRAGLGGVLSHTHMAGLQGLCCLVCLAVGLWLGLGFLALSPPYLLLTLLLCLYIGLALPLKLLRDRIRSRQNLILKSFPFLLDMTTLCIEAGLNLHGALIQTAQCLPVGPLRQELLQALSEMRTGVSRAQALEEMATRIGLQEIKQWVGSMVQAESLGMGLGPVLRAQADQRRSERFLRAEKLALEAPVKMLLPLVLCIFPCTFIVIAFPIGMKLLDSGL